MHNSTIYSTRQIRAYIKWVKWKYQPDRNWVSKIDEIFIEDFYDRHKKITYKTLTVTIEPGIRDVTIPLDKFIRFVKYIDIRKPKRFNIKDYNK